MEVSAVQPEDVDANSFCLSCENTQDKDDWRLRMTEGNYYSRVMFDYFLALVMILLLMLPLANLHLQDYQG